MGKRDIERPYKNPWTYAASWRAGDAYAGRRWLVINICHLVEVSEHATEKEAKAWIRAQAKFKREAARAARMIAKRPKPLKQETKLSLRQEVFLAKKLEQKFFKSIPFPA